MMNARKLATSLTYLICLHFIFLRPALAENSSLSSSLTIIPPSPVTDKITLSIRGAVKNQNSFPVTVKAKFYLDENAESSLLHQERMQISPTSARGIYFDWPTTGQAGEHRIIFSVESEDGNQSAEQLLKIYRGDQRSTGMINGAWSGFYMWGNEGMLWMEELVKMTDTQWREMVRAMNEIGMNILVIQEMFRNQEYVDAHNMDEEGYKGKAFYPSALFPGRMNITSKDPLEAILSAADDYGMHVFIPVGIYAWFDYSEGSLQWHKKVASELWERYGHHPSFYGWYISEEIHGWLSPEKDDKTIQMRHHQEIVHFFKEFQAHVRALAPDKPVMLASNCHYVDKARQVYPQLLKHLDILCPFGFHRMPEDDMSGEAAAKMLQKLCDDAGTHFWMDLETFLFGPYGELYPRPVEGLVSDLNRFPNFEKILCFQFSGLMNAPWMSRKPGGEATVKLYRDYKQYYEKKRQEFEHRELLKADDLPAYKNPAFPVEKRVDDLLGRMNQWEKIDLISGQGFVTKPNIRLGIPQIVMTDGPLGPNGKGRATNYSASINMAATWDTSLIRRVAEEIGRETRILGYNMLLGPCVNIVRVPHGGRTFESFGEDPYLMSSMAVAYINGVQSQRVISCIKHFAVNNQEWNRGDVDVSVDERALREIYFPAFRAAVQKAHVWSVMSAYNKFRGDYCSSSKYLLTDVLKNEWGFSGFVVSDWGGVHNTIGTANAGLDLEMPDGRYMGEDLVAAVKNRKVSDQIVDDKVRRLLRVMFKAGLFDESVSTYGGLADTGERRALALEVAQKSIVLLKNEDHLLPLDLSTTGSIAVIGPNADEARMYGGGSGYLPAHHAVSPLQGIQEKLGDKIKIRFVKGGRLKRLSLPPIDSTLLIPAQGKSGEHGLLGEYYNNRELEGKPVWTRIDKEVDFNWDSGSPVPGIVREDLFSARWRGKFISPGSGVYELGVMSDNGCRLYLDGELIIDSWIVDKASALRSIYVNLEKDRMYDIQIEFFENVGTSEVHLGLAYYGQGNELEQAVQAASVSDYAIICAGLRETLEGEGNDRSDLSLPKDQIELIQAVSEVNSATIVILNNGGPLLMDEWINNVPVIIEAFYPGQEGGRALADILAGDVNPSGKLPITLIKKWADSPVYNTYPGQQESVNYAEGSYIGYRFFDKNNTEPLFPFGFGLSYTTFSYDSLVVRPAMLTSGDTAEVMVRVENTGPVAGDEVIQLYVQDTKATIDRPVKELKGFTRVTLQPGESKNISLKLDTAALSFYNVKGKQWMAEKGRYKIMLGSSSRDIRLEGNIELK